LAERWPAGFYDRRVVAFTVEDLARTALIRILPRSRYRTAAQNDSRFQAFVPNVARIAYRQQGATPAFLLFSGPGQDPRAAALSAAAVAGATWRPNAIQRTVRPGVVVVHVAPGAQLAAAGPVVGAAVPAAIWTVDSETGRVEVAGKPPGSPPIGEIQRAAATLAKGVPAPSMGELDLAERAVMQVRTRGMPPRVFSGVVGVLLFIFVMRYGLAGIFSLMALPSAILGGDLGSTPGLAFVEIASLVANVLLLAGILLGVGLVFNFRNLAFRLPGFSSPVPTTRNLAWGGYAVVMIALAVILNGALPAAERSTVQGAQGDYTHVSATASDDGGQVYVAVGGDLTVDLSGWPQSEWPGVQFKTSNPSVLTLDSTPASGAAPSARFSSHQEGASRVDATSADGKYTFELRVSTFNA
jgi:hypothetical protein